MKKKLALILCVFMYNIYITKAQTTLNVGDIAIIQNQTDAPDSFAFVTFVDIDAGTGIFFTDCGADSAGFNTPCTEGAVKYTVPTGGLTAGDIIKYNKDSPSADFTDYNDSRITLNFATSTTGDQVIVFQDATSATGGANAGNNPTFIFASNTASKLFTGNKTDNNETGLPNGLNDTTAPKSALGLGFGNGVDEEVDNAVYNGTYDFSVGGLAAAKLALTDPANYISSNDTNDTAYAAAVAAIPASLTLVVTDTAPPAVQSIALQGLPTGSATSLTFTVTFDENANGISTDDFELTKTGPVFGTIASVSSATGTSANITVNGISGIGTLRLDLKANTDITDDAGNGNGTNGNVAAFTTGSVHNVDRIAPTATITISDTNLKIGETATVTILFSEAVSGFENTDLTIPNGTLTAVSSSDGNVTFTGTFTPSTDTEEASNTIVLNNTGVTDTAGNTGTGTTDSNSYAIDTLAPSVTITSTESSPTKTNPIPVTVTFSETVTGFDASDLTIVNGTASDFSGSGATYTFNIVPNAAGNITVDIAADTVNDTATNGNTAATQFSINYDPNLDTAPPVVQSITLQGSPNASEASITLKVTFNENANGITTDDFELTKTGTATGAIASVSSATGTSVDVTVNNITEIGTLRLDLKANTDITDDTGNGNGTNGNVAAFTTGSVHNVDRITPTAIVTINDINLKIGEKAIVTVTFSETVTGFDNTDLTIENGTLTPVSSSDGNVTFTTTFTPTANIEEAANLIVLNNAGVTDTAGNTGTGTTNSNNYAIDTLAPSVTITSSESSPTKANPIPVTVTFSESVTGFDVGDLVITNGTASDFSGSGITYTFNIVPTASGNITVNIAADSAIDTATNGNIAATQFSIEYDPTLNTANDILNNVQIFPNPAENHIQIKTDYELNSIVLFDVSGKVIFEKSLHTFKNNHTIDLSKIAAGMYWLRLNTSNTFAIKQLVIK